MKLNDTAQGYANNLFGEKVEEISTRRDREAERIISFYASRGLGRSGPLEGALMQNELERLEETVVARKDSLLPAYEKSGLPINDECIQQILVDVKPVLEAGKRAIEERFRNRGARTGGGLMGNTWVSNQVREGADAILARVARSLRIRRDEYALLSGQARITATQPGGTTKDGLTNLFDRAALDSDLSLWLGDETRHPLSLLMLDLDKFKTVNDEFGHQAGDEVLKRTAAVCVRVVGQKGKVFRYGGEEILVLLPNFEESEALALGERIRKTLALETFTNYPHKITCSIGLYTASVADYADLAVGRVDTAMYASKDSGRNCVTVWTQDHGDKRTPQQE